jgi:hypothetical protein
MRRCVSRFLARARDLGRSEPFGKFKSATDLTARGTGLGFRASAAS